MTGPHEAPWLHEALDSLLAGEPASSPVAVSDDVRRGRAARAAMMRRRALSLTAVAVVAATGIPLVRLVGSSPGASSVVTEASGPSSSTPSLLAPPSPPAPSGPSEPVSTPPSPAAMPSAPMLSPTQSSADVALARSTPCTPAQLVVTYAGRDGFGGTNVVAFGVRNVSATPCGLVGPAGVRIRPLSLTYRVQQGGLSGSDRTVVDVMLLRPGSSTSFVITKYRCDYREGMASTDVDVRVNGALVLALPFSSGSNGRGTTECSGGPTPDPGNTVSVYGWQLPGIPA